MRVGIIEDDKTIRESLKVLLERYGYKCHLFDDFNHMIEQLLSEEVDLYIIDIHLPVYDGFYLCREIRKNRETPIIFLTSRNTDMDELMGMQLGADDFISKPFNTQILLARIESVMRRYNQQEHHNVESIGGIKLNLSNAMVSYKDQKIELTLNEQKMLYILMQHKAMIVGRNEMMTHLWSTDAFIDDNTLTVNMNRLRSKLASIGLKDCIETKRGQGYMLREME